MDLKPILLTPLYVIKKQKQKKFPDDLRAPSGGGATPMVSCIFEGMDFECRVGCATHDCISLLACATR